jgi:hypothetical protein
MRPEVGSMTAMTAERSMRPALATPRRTPAGATLRLTRRGRLVVVGTVLAGCAVGFSVGAGSTSQAGSAATHHTRPAVVTVQTGESLWQLATRVAPHADPRLVVSEIERLNRLSSATVYAGQQLRVPRYR